MRVGLFFGSFNPIHIGHLMVANAMVQDADIEEVWFVVSPQNPFKKKSGLLHEFDRLDLVNKAIDDNYKFKASDIEFAMPKPSYTVDTLAYLSDKYPAHKFKLIIGEDNLASFPKWKNHEAILEYYGLLVYPRPGYGKEVPATMLGHTNVQVVEAPLIDLSATYIRKRIAAGKSIRYLVSPEVEAQILAKKFYS